MWTFERSNDEKGCYYRIREGGRIKISILDDDLDLAMAVCDVLNLIDEIRMENESPTEDKTI